MTGRPHDDENLPAGLDPDVLERLVTIGAVTVHLGGTQHEATVSSAESGQMFSSTATSPPA